MPKVRKTISKRVTLRKKYSVDKKVKDHKKKLKKEIRKMKKTGIVNQKPMKKIQGLPNLYPYKQDLLDSIERKEAIDQEMKDHVKALRNAQKNLPGGTLENYAAEVQAKVTVHEDLHGKLTDQEIQDAEKLMQTTGEMKHVDRQMG